VSDFSSIFLPSGENGVESVFEIQYSNLSATYDWAHTTRGQGNLSVQQCGIRNLNGSAAMPFANGWSFNLPTRNLQNAYTAGDKRKDATCLDIEAYMAANPSFGISYQVAPYRNTGLYNHKYQPRKGESSGQIELNYSNNFRTIRFADVLLMAAEAFNKSTTPNDVKAQTYLNRVRRRAFGDLLHDITNTGSTLYEAILTERRLELAMEGERYFDLVRTGKAATILGTLGYKTGKHELFPIPQSEVEVSGLTQNPGY
jgi:starch-binding outer membrane protein, SusD/RagB family